ncbi:MAG: peptidoglycan-binding domain-containing protein [Firmicutes bacterium]|nr:peptidoglycan-binding domain-containing protein [Bacillota bacterium]
MKENKNRLKRFTFKRIASVFIAVAMVLTCVSIVRPGTAVYGATYDGKMPELPNKIAKQAIKCSWPYGTAKSKYSYPGGKPTAEYAAALTKAYGSRSSWGKQTRAGASCDVFVGTVVRSCGYDTSFPRGLEPDLTYLPSSSKFEKVNVYKKEDFRPGDIIMVLFRGGGGHISIFVEYKDTAYIANAHYSLKTYGVRDAKAKTFKPSSYKMYSVYRAKNPCTTSFSKGDNSYQVKLLQEFLNWAGYFCGKPDGSYGANTEAAVKKFQQANGLEADGKFGSGSLAKAYEVAGKQPFTATESNMPSSGKPAATTSTGTSAAAATSSSGSKYTGAFPSSTVSKSKGKKAEIKKWQTFLKWYGYSKIKVDGDFGYQTIKYTKAFQKKMKLKRDGIVGPVTVKKAKQVRK